MGRGIGAESEMMLLRGGAQIVEHHAGLNARPPRAGIEVNDATQIFRKIHDHSDVAALAGETRAAAARQHGRAIAARHRERFNDVVGNFGDHDADRDLAVIRPVGGIERARAGIEAHFTANPAAEIGGETRRVHIGRIEFRILGIFGFPEPTAAPRVDGQTGKRVALMV